MGRGNVINVGTAIMLLTIKADRHSGGYDGPFSYEIFLCVDSIMQGYYIKRKKDMDRIWEWYENLNERVHVCDADSYDLVYMNRKALKEYGFTSLEDLKGKKCYSVLRKKEAPCEGCCNNELRAGEFREYQEYNEVSGKTYSVKDTLWEGDGKKFRIELAFDMTLLAEQEELIQEYKKNENMINNALKIALSASSEIESLECLIEFLGQELKAERMYIFEEQSDGSVSNTHEWVAKGATPEKDNLQNIPFTAVSQWYNEFLLGKSVIIPDVEAIKDEQPLTYEFLKPQNIRTIIVHPIYDNDHIIGFYGVDNAPMDRLGNISSVLETIGYFMTSTLKRAKLMNKLERLGFYDRLTGVKNRHALEDYVNSLSNEESLGVIYTDVTGLKRMNDSQGHKAGDELLLRACKCLKTSFREYEIFRIGGDEFCILCKKIREEEIEKRIRDLRADMKVNQAIMAIGYVWVESYNNNFEALLSLADNLMYRDKREYYARPSTNRRKI